MPDIKTNLEKQKRPALFLDRDGVINVDKGYVDTPEGFEFIPGAIKTIAKFNQANWLVFIVTNQTGIAHGHYTEADMFRVHAYMSSELSKQKAHIDRIYYCPYDIRGSTPQYAVDSYDRKPSPGMIIKALNDFGVDDQKSVLIGDKDKDLEAGKSAGITSYLFDEANLWTFVNDLKNSEIQRLISANN